MGPIQTLDEARRWLTRRAGLIALITLLVAVAGLVLALNTDRVYHATAVIQITNPVISNGGEEATQTVTRRLQAIEQRLMARDNLLALGEQYGIFEGLNLTTAERTQMMRQSIRIEAVAATQAGFTRDGSLAALIISASANRPETAAALANELAADVVRENAETRRARVVAALRFFQEEEVRIEALIAALEAEIAAFHIRNEAYMAGSLTLRREEMGRLSEARLEAERDIAQARSELATMDGGSRGLTLRRQTQLTELIGQKTAELAGLNARIDEIQGMFLRGAELELEIGATNRRMTQLQTQLTTAVERRRAAEIGARLEDDDQSERFDLLEAALPPDYPVSRSRKTIVMAAVVAGGMLGLALAYLVEWLNPVLRTAAMFEREMQLRPVISLPFQLPRRERRRRQAIWAAGLGLPLLGLLAAALALGLV